jgi:hypothetical protein
MPNFFAKYETLKPDSYDDLPIKYDMEVVLKCMKQSGYKCTQKNAEWVIKNHMNSLDSYDIAGIIIETLTRRKG